MKNSKYIIDQLKDFCYENNPDEIREKTRLIFLSLMESELFHSMGKLEMVYIIEYIYEIEKILLSAFKDFNLKTHA